jgi:hypothetical protein
VLNTAQSGAFRPLWVHAPARLVAWAPLQFIREPYIFSIRGVDSAAYGAHVCSATDILKQTALSISICCSLRHYRWDLSPPFGTIARFGTTTVASGEGQTGANKAFALIDAFNSDFPERPRLFGTSDPKTHYLIRT